MDVYGYLAKRLGAAHVEFLKDPTPQNRTRIEAIEDLWDWITKEDEAMAPVECVAYCN